MRIRIFRAFASNNSGSYTIVGTFSSAETASEVADLLRAISAEHDKWFAEHGEEEDGESPLDVFAREQGLSESKPGRDDHWPQYGAPASVVTVGHQVLVHAAYTVTMPRLFGEFFYRRGGRVDVELDHSHDDLALQISFYVPGVQWGAPEPKLRVDEVERALTSVLPGLVARSEHDNRPPIAPVFHDGFWGSRHLTAVFSNLVDGVETVRLTAAQHGVQIHVRVTECSHGIVDPLAHLRSSVRPWGKTRVILWSIGAHRVKAMKALREVMGADLTEAKAAIEDLPKEVLVEVDQAYADRAVEVLRDAGCDAEAVVATRGGG